MCYNVLLSRRGSRHARPTMIARQAVHLTPSQSSVAAQLLFYKHSISVSPLFATLTSRPQLAKNTATLSPFLATLTAPAPATPLFATLTQTAGVSHPLFPFWNSPRATPAASPLTITPLFSYSYELFCRPQMRNSFIFLQFQTLSKKHPGWGTPSAHPGMSSRAERGICFVYAGELRLLGVQFVADNSFDHRLQNVSRHRLQHFRTYLGEHLGHQVVHARLRRAGRGHGRFRRWCDRLMLRGLSDLRRLFTDGFDRRRRQRHLFMDSFGLRSTLRSFRRGNGFHRSRWYEFRISGRLNRRRCRRRRRLFHSLYLRHWSLMLLQDSRMLPIQGSNFQELPLGHVRRRTLLDRMFHDSRGHQGRFLHHDRLSICRLRRCRVRHSDFGHRSGGRDDRRIPCRGQLAGFLCLNLPGTRYRLEPRIRQTRLLWCGLDRLQRSHNWNRYRLMHRSFRRHFMRCSGWRHLHDGLSRLFCRRYRDFFFRAGRDRRRPRISSKRRRLRRSSYIREHRLHHRGRNRLGHIFGLDKVRFFFGRRPLREVRPRIRHCRGPAFPPVANLPLRLVWRREGLIRRVSPPGVFGRLFGFVFRLLVLGGAPVALWRHLWVHRGDESQLLWFFFLCDRRAQQVAKRQRAAAGIDLHGRGTHGNFFRLAAQRGQRNAGWRGNRGNAAERPWRKIRIHQQVRRRAGRLRRRDWRARQRNSGSRQRGLHHGNQRIGRDKRFFQDAVGAHALRFLLIQGIERSHQQDYRNMRQRRIRLHVLANFISVAHGHKHIGEHQVRPNIGDLAHGGFAVAHGHHFDTLISQGQPHHLLDVAVVVRNQNLGHRTPSGDTPPARSS